MQRSTNQKLAEIAQVSDLIIGSNIINLILTQIAENRSLTKVFKELLHVNGSEINMRKAEEYVKTNVEMNFYEIGEILKRKNEIAIGYKKQYGNEFRIVNCPKKSEKIIFSNEGYIISLSKD